MLGCMWYVVCACVCAYTACTIHVQYVEYVYMCMYNVMLKYMYKYMYMYHTYVVA